MPFTQQEHQAADGCAQKSAPRNIKRVMHSGVYLSVANQCSPKHGSGENETLTP